MIAGIEHAPGKIEPRGISCCSPLLDLGPAGISESKQFCHLVERLARRVIHRSPENAIIAHISDFDQERVSPADNQRHIRLDLAARCSRDRRSRPGKEWRKQMTFEMI